jgi:hypothetical protein
MARKSKKPTTNPNPASCACGKSCYFSGQWTCQAWCLAQRPAISEDMSNGEKQAAAQIFGSVASAV